jgi:hypothetical protein
MVSESISNGGNMPGYDSVETFSYSDKEKICRLFSKLLPTDAPYRISVSDDILEIESNNPSTDLPSGDRLGIVRINLAEMLGELKQPQIVLLSQAITINNAPIEIVYLILINKLLKLITEKSSSKSFQSGSNNDQKFLLDLQNNMGLNKFYPDYENILIMTIELYVKKVLRVDRDVYKIVKHWTYLETAEDIRAIRKIIQEINKETVATNPDNWKEKMLYLHYDNSGKLILKDSTDRPFAEMDLPITLSKDGLIISKIKFNLSHNIKYYLDFFVNFNILLIRDHLKLPPMNEEVITLCYTDRIRDAIQQRLKKYRQ